MPPWATEEAVTIVRSAILEAEPVPMTTDVGPHAAVVRIRAAARGAAVYRQAMEATGVPTAMPFLDRQVVEACLAVRPWERTDPWQPKPLLQAAFGGMVPSVALARRTKGHYTTDIRHGWCAHRREVTGLLEDSHMIRLGLVDPHDLRVGLREIDTGALPLAWLTDLVAIEVWLRHLEGSSTRPRRPRSATPSRRETVRLSQHSVVPALRPPATVRNTAQPAVPRLPTPRPLELAPGVSRMSVDDGLVLVDRQRGTLYHLNASGAAVLTVLTGSSVGVGLRDQVATPRVAALMLAARCTLSLERAWIEVRALVEDLRAAGLVVIG